MNHQSTLASLQSRIALLERINEQLRKENEFLKSHPTIVAGMKGEILIADLTGGYLTSYAAKHDITLKNKAKIEVKFSNHRPDKNSKNIPQRNRWAWNKPEGHLNRGKDNDFLLLVGNKDLRHTDAYLDNSPFVYFLLPAAVVKDVNSTVVRKRSQGGTLNLDTDLYGIQEGWQRGLKSKRKQFVLVSHMVSEETIRDLEKRAIAHPRSANI